MNAADTYIVEGAGRGRRERWRWREMEGGEEERGGKGRRGEKLVVFLEKPGHTHEQYFD